MNSLMLMDALFGFSVGISALLALAFATAFRNLELPWQSRVAGYVMLLGLALTQWGNAELLQADAARLPPRSYIAVLFIQSFAFYWLLLGVLRPADRWRPAEWWLPLAVLILAALTPARWGISVSLGMGTVYALHLGWLLYRLRDLRRWFALELPVVGMFALMGMTVAIVGLLTPGVLDWSVYSLIYASLIAVGFFLVTWLLLTVPDLSAKTNEAVASSYSQSTLGKVDRQGAIARLRQLFEVDKIYQDEGLGLAAVAELMELSTHQLSELVNSCLDVGFSRLVRRYRVEAAQKMLIDEPSASVLSVGLAVGFNSQSAFYVAFKEQLGMVPGQYRRAQLRESAKA